VKVKATPPIEGVLYGYGLDLSRCIGCRRCAYGCIQENNQSRDPQIQWIQVLQLSKERGVDLEEAELYYNPAKVPEKGHFYMPVQCQQCESPPCVKVCPVQATWKERDGITVVDYNWCIGCRYCMAACPYGARHFNWKKPGLPAAEMNPETHYLGNRPRPVGVVEKCTFCIQRVRNVPGRYTACVEVCPVGARKFGNLLDPEGEIRYLIENKRVFILKEDLNTRPKFYYFYAT
jgi:molybdopterin-containing oxidoreductase family iron-sulfur binding subunit